MCCRSNSDTCLPNGLCRQANSDILWRESCTESDWDSRWCLKLCVDGDDGKTDVQVLQCDDGSFCCHRDQDATDCCNLHQGKFVINGTTGYSVIDNPKASDSAASTTLQKTTSSASNSASSPASSSTSSTILSTPRSNPVMSTLSPSSAATPPPPKSSSSTNSGAIAGGVVGGVAAFSIILVGSWCYRRRQQRKMSYTGPLPKEYESPTSMPPMIKTGGGMHEVEGSLDRQKELDGNEKYEIASENRNSQLPEMA
ncbi:MAG: hypothetical protein Q9214_004665 [Letrouitia sp. 1 TL-2023]